MLKFSAPLQNCAQGPTPLIWDLAFAFPSLSFRLIPVTIKLEFNRAAVVLLYLADVPAVLSETHRVLNPSQQIHL